MGSPRLSADPSHPNTAVSPSELGPQESRNLRPLLGKLCVIVAHSPPGTGPCGPSQHPVGCILALVLQGWWEAWGPGLGPDWVGCSSLGGWEMGSGAFLPLGRNARVGPSPTGGDRPGHRRAWLSLGDVPLFTLAPGKRPLLFTPTQESSHVSSLPQNSPSSSFLPTLDGAPTSARHLVGTSSRWSH